MSQETIEHNANNDDINERQDINNAMSSKLFRKSNLIENRRPNIVVNQYPENEIDFRKKVVPGNSSYSDVTRSGKNIKILCDSIPKGFRMREFNDYVISGNVGLKSFPGATAKHLKHYALPTLHEEKPDAVIVHVGCNDLSTKRGAIQAVNINDVVVNDILQIGITCMEQGVGKIFISSIVRSNYFKKQQLINQVNDCLKEKCVNYGFIFIDNCDIKREHLWRDGTHLVESGKVKLANNFINSINNFL